MSKSSALEEDPRRGDRSVGSCALPLPLSTWPDNSSLLIVGVGMVTLSEAASVFDINSVAKYDYLRPGKALHHLPNVSTFYFVHVRTHIQRL